MAASLDNYEPVSARQVEKGVRNAARLKNVKDMIYAKVFHKQPQESWPA
jgi:hypothetical protein